MKTFLLRPRTLALVLALALVFIGASRSHAATVFPPTFKWCVATAAHQIEGNNVNSDWWLWEQIPGNTKDRSGLADDHWNRVEEDTQLLTDLHVQQYRFSIEWAKIEPQEGHWDFAAVEHYRNEIELLRTAHIEPIITLHHFSMPQWLRAKGGWEWDGAPDAFARYAAFIVEQVGDGVRDWITINEPMVHILLGYTANAQPPGRTGGIDTLKAPVIGLLKAHAAAYHAMKDTTSRLGRPEIRIGLANHLRVFDPKNELSTLDAILANSLDNAWNWAFPTAAETGRLKYEIPILASVDEEIPNLAGTQDFIGVNYYTRDMVHVDLSDPQGFTLTVPDGAEVTDVGWEIYPEGFYRVLKGAAEHFPEKPILITENGLADSSDTKRAAFLDSHLEAVLRAINEGVPVENYCHWSLIDNFEWREGFGPRFGLYAVDYSTFERTPRPSAARFSRIASTGLLH